MRISTTALVAVMALGSACLGQTTRSQTVAPTINVWTCEAHEQFRMTAKGECPVCTQVLVSRTVDAVEPYPLETCPVSGLKLGEMGPPIVMLHEGREVRFCSDGCIATFQKKADELLSQIDQRIIEQQVAHSPLTTCPVSQESLDAMGGPVNKVHNNRLVRFCCNGCVRGFKKNPSEYLAVLDAAVIAAQTPQYPLKTCPISKMKLGSMGEPVDIVVANQLVRFCCTGCVTAFYKAPSAHLSNLNTAWGQVADTSVERKGGKGGGHDHDGHDHDH